MKPGKPDTGTLTVGTLYWVQLCGCLEEKDVRDVALVAGVLGTKPRAKVVLDFSRVQHMDYRAGHLLLAVSRLVRMRGGNLVVTGVSPYVWDLLRLGLAQESAELLDEPGTMLSDGVPRVIRGRLLQPVQDSGPGGYVQFAGFAPPSPN